MNFGNSNATVGWFWPGQPTLLALEEDRSTLPSVLFFNDGYHPLLGLWLIDMALTGNWIDEPPSGSLSTTFGDRDYLRVTRLKGIQKLFPDILGDDDELQMLDDEIVSLEEEDDEIELPKVNRKANVLDTISFYTDAKHEIFVPQGFRRSGLFIWISKGIRSRPDTALIDWAISQDQMESRT